MIICSLNISTIIAKATDNKTSSSLSNLIQSKSDLTWGTWKSDVHHGHHHGHYHVHHGHHYVHHGHHYVHHHRRLVRNGRWEVRNPVSGLCVGLNGRYLVLRPCGASRSTQWNLSGDRFTNVKNGKVWDVYHSRKRNGTRVIVYRWHGGNNQRWSFHRHRRGHLSIKNKHSKKCLDVARFGKRNGSKIHQWTCHGRTNQQWQLVRPRPIVRHVYNGRWEVRNPVSGLCVGLSGRNLVLRHCGRSRRTQWIKSGDRFTNVYNGKVWDVYHSRKRNGTKIIVYRWHGGNNQRWTIHKHRKGHWQIRNKHSRKCMDVARFGKRDGSKIHQWRCHRKSNQQWQFVRI